MHAVMVENEPHALASPPVLVTEATPPLSPAPSATLVSSLPVRANTFNSLQAMVLVAVLGGATWFLLWKIVKIVWVRL